MDDQHYFAAYIPSGFPRYHYKVAKLYGRLIVARDARSWEECCDTAIDTAVDLIKDFRIHERDAMQLALRKKLKGSGIETDKAAALDVLRFACATGRVALVPIIAHSGYPEEAFTTLLAIDELTMMRSVVAEVLEKYGWIDAPGLQRAAVNSPLTANEETANLVLAHAAARGLGEYSRRGLFYKRPFLKDA